MDTHHRLTLTVLREACELVLTPAGHGLSALQAVNVITDARGIAAEDRVYLEALGALAAHAGRPMFDPGLAASEAALNAAIDALRAAPRTPDVE